MMQAESQPLSGATIQKQHDPERVESRPQPLLHRVVIVIQNLAIPIEADCTVVHLANSSILLEGGIMLQYKPVTLEKLICVCDRCGKVMEQGVAETEWQERFIISFRAGFGSIFGDGNLVECDLCQKCVQIVIGKWMRITQEDPLATNHKLANDAEKFLQPYQYGMVQERIRMQSDITALFKGRGEMQEKRRNLAERLGVSEEQAAAIAYDYLLQATETKSDADVPSRQ